MIQQTTRFNGFTRSSLKRTPRESEIPMVPATGSGYLKTLVSGKTRQFSRDFHFGLPLPGSIHQSASLGAVGAHFLLVNACASPKLDLHENNGLAPWHVPVMQRTFMAGLINDNLSFGRIAASGEKNS
jgi:hypothetical protein